MQNVLSFRNAKGYSKYKCKCYKIVLGLITVDVNKFFSFAPVSNTRGHRYKLLTFVEQSTRNVYDIIFFCRRIVIWNNLPPAG